MRGTFILFLSALITYNFIKRKPTTERSSLYKLCTDPARCCSEIVKAYPDYVLAGNGKSMDELRSKYGEEVMEYWVHYGCVSTSANCPEAVCPGVCPDEGYCQRIRSAYNILPDGSNLCSLPAHEKVSWNCNKCQPTQNFNNCPPKAPTDCDKLRAAHPDFAADVAAGVNDRNLLAKYGMTLWSQWRNAQC